MIKFIKAFLVFLRMYKEGFFFSDNTHYDQHNAHWGFYRFNHKNQAALFDIDFLFGFGKTETSYFHIHGDDYRVGFDLKGNAISVLKLRAKKYDLGIYESVTIHHL